MGAEHGIPSGEREERGLAVMSAPQLPALPQEMSIEQVEERVNKVRLLQQRLMKADIHYGVIPGTERKDSKGKDISKQVLLKPGAELLLHTFMLDPQYKHEIRQEGPHREIVSTCTLYHIPTGRRVASGEGCCSTWESKYRWRYASKCPECDAPALMRSKFGAKGWYCNPKRDGCGANFDKADSRIKSGKFENEDLADQYNTVLKMANKRSLIDATLKATACSDSFTQDIGDDEDDHRGYDSDDEQDSSRAESRQVDNKPRQQQQQPKSTAPKTSEPPREEKPTETAKPPTDAPTGVGPALSQGHLNLLKKMLQNAHLVESDDMIINTMSWLGEQFHLEVDFDDQKSADENLVVLLRKIPISKVAEVRAAITKKGEEATTSA